MNLGKHLQTREREINPTVVFQTSSVPLVLGKFQWGPVGQPLLMQNLAEFTGTYGEPVRTGTLTNRHEWYAVDDLFNYDTSVFVERITGEDSTNAALALKQVLHFGVASAAEFNLEDTVSIVLTGDNFHGKVIGVDTEENKVAVGLFGNLPGLLETDITDQTLLGESTTSESITGLEVKHELKESTGVLINNEDEIITESVAVTMVEDDVIKFVGRYPGEMGNNLRVVYCDNSNFDTFTFAGISMKRFFNRATLNEGEIAIAVLRTVKGRTQVLETHLGSINQDATDEEGRTLYVNEVLFRNSNYIYGFTNNPKYNQLLNIKAHTNITLSTFLGENSTGSLLTNGVDGAVEVTDVLTALSLLPESQASFKYLVDSSILLDGTHNASIKSAMTTTAANMETACAILGINPNSGINLAQTQSAITQAIITYKNTLGINDSYATFAGNLKWKYDRFNDEYFWTSMASDLTGLRILSDNNYFEWYASAGFNRGVIRNAGSIGRLAVYPQGDLLDDLNRNKINAFISSPQDGIICMGNNTMLATNTGLSKLHIRMLLIVLKSAIKDFAKREIHEFNNIYTRNRITSAISQFLERVQANQGITDFLVVCDESNNTAAVIDNNELICDIFIKPVRSAEFITLNFTSVGESVQFEEIL